LLWTLPLASFQQPNTTGSSPIKQNFVWPPLELLQCNTMLVGFLDRTGMLQSPPPSFSDDRGLPAAPQLLIRHCFGCSCVCWTKFIGWTVDFWNRRRTVGDAWTWFRFNVAADIFGGTGTGWDGMVA
jgi:hypothetical protein